MAPTLPVVRRRSLAVPAGVLAGALLFFSACRDDTRNATRDTAISRSAVTDALVGPGFREGTWQDADEQSTWRAVLDGPHVTHIDEVSTFTDSARSIRRFRFDSTGALVALREERAQLVFGERAMPDTVRTIIDLEWDRDSLSRSAKRVNGVDRLLQPFEVDNFRAHASELLRVVRAGSAPSPRDTTS